MEHTGKAERIAGSRSDGGRQDTTFNVEPSGRAWMDKGSRCLECDEGARQGGGRIGTRMTERTRKGSFVEPLKEDQEFYYSICPRREQ